MRKILTLLLLFSCAVSFADTNITAAAAKPAVVVSNVIPTAADPHPLEVKDPVVEESAEHRARRRIETRVYRLAHASADEIASRLNATWSGDFGTSYKVTKMASSFPEANAVMVTAPVFIQEACQKVIDEVDRDAPQVYIEARFVELGASASHKLGIDWSMLGGMKGSMQLGAGIEGYNLGSAVQSYSRSKISSSETTAYQLSGGASSSGISSSGNGNVSHFTGTLDFSQMELTLRALEASGDSRLFSNPKIIVSSGKKATVDMTTKYPNVKISAKRTSTSGNDSLDLDMQMASIPGEDKLMFAKEAFFSWGISLDVTPRIGTNGLINVSIVPTVSSQTDWVQAGTTSTESDQQTISAKYPVIEVQRLVTEFNMASGTTAVIGGLSRTVEEQADNGIPLLRDIPYLGPRIFGSKVRVKSQKEILVFVTVGLVNPNNMPREAGLPKNAMLGRQYTRGIRHEPGDRDDRQNEGVGSLDLRSLEEQAAEHFQEAQRKGQVESR